MKYGILLWPHANARYQEAERPLSLAELRLLMAGGLSEDPSFERHGGADFLCFDSGLAQQDVTDRVRDHAHLLLLSEMRPDGGFLPLCGPREAYLGADLPAIQKYKGKTNEVFTRFLINMAVYSGSFAGKADRRLRVFDPMCGRGTALFEAVNRGYDAVGSDMDKADIREAGAFFKKYLEYHKFKHQVRESSLTLPGKRQLPRRAFTFASSADAFKAGDARELSLILGDASDVARALPERHFHAIAADLPYGVQHASGVAGKPEPLERMLARVLPQLRSSLMPGGAIALSFNVNTLGKQKVIEALRSAKFEPLEGPAYEGLAHWVEQAVTRDVAVGIRR